MKRIPFYSSDKDAVHTAPAIYQMLFEYFMHRNLSPEEARQFAGIDEDDHASWPLKPLTSMARQGFDIRMVSPLDYNELRHRGQEYIQEVFAPDKAAWILQHTNISDIQPYVDDFLHFVAPEHYQVTLRDIDAMLAEDRLVIVPINLRTLQHRPGYAERMVLILQREGEQYILHDPGEPAEYRRLSRHQLWDAIGGDTNTAEVIGVIYRKAHIRRRLDQYVLTRLPRLSRSFAAKLIEQGRVLVNGKPSKPGYKIQDGDVITINYSEEELDDIPDIDLPILYEDNDCIVINKPAGVLTHAQGSLQPEPTVATFIRNRVTGMEGERAGIVHRLDRATSGVLIAAKHQAALSFLQKQFAERKVKKTYVAIIEGHLTQPEAVISMPIERNPKAPATFRVGTKGKPAVTRYKVLQESERSSLVELKPETGRTHQLRVHMAKLGHPIVGDPLYGKGSFGDRLYLHAFSLELVLPNGQQATFTAPLPQEFKEYLGK